MKFILNNDTLVIDNPVAVNTGSIADYEIEVEADENWEGLTIVAKICQEKENIAFERAVINGKVFIDIDALKRYTIGFIGYTIENDEKVYQKSTNLKVIPYVKGAGEIEVTEEQELPTPSEWEMYLQQVQDFINDANEIIDTANNLDLDANKVGNTTTVTITKKDGTTKSVQILDGEKGQDGQDYVITQQDYQEIANIVEQQVEVPTKTSDLINDNGFIDNSVNDLINYTLTTQTGSKIDLEINSSNFQLTAKLKDKNNNLISTSNVIDLPIESMVVNATYSNGIITLTLQNGNTLSVDISDIVSGLVKPEDLTDYVKNTNYATSSKGGVIKTNTNYGTSIANGILIGQEKTYANYQTANNNMFIAKGTLENVLTEKNLETANNKVTSLSSSSTDTQYPSAKCVYDLVGDIESILEELDIGRRC